MKNVNWTAAVLLAAAVTLRGGVAHAHIPEMDPGLSGSALTLLAGGLLMVFGSRAAR